MLVPMEGAEESNEARLVRSRLARLLLIGLGTVCVGLGVLGAFLPLLPTTVFMLLAAACYARGSDRFYKRLVNHRMFGPTIRAWRQRRCIPSKAKRAGIALIVIVFSVSVGGVIDKLYVCVPLALFGVGLILFLLRIPSSDHDGSMRDFTAG